MKIDRSKAPVKRKDLIVPGMFFLTGFTQGFYVTLPYTLEGIQVTHVLAPADEDESGKLVVKKQDIQVLIHVGGSDGSIVKTHYIDVKKGKGKMVGTIPLKDGDIVSLSTNRALNVVESVCISYNMRMKTKEV